jgi:beta-glucosidase
LLRDRYAYDGIVCADWGVITDVTMPNGYVWPARAWGVEHLGRAERVRKALDAGVDQFGGETATDLVVGLVGSGDISESRIDVSARRILRLKFDLGLFDNPYVDADAVAASVGKPAWRKLGHESQQRAMTLLKNAATDHGPALPLPGNSLRIFAAGIDPAAIAPFATTVETPEAADLAILRIATPWYPVDSENPFALGFHHGDLDFKGEEKRELMQLLETVPTVVVIYLDRPAVIPDIAGAAAAVIADYGASDQAVTEVLFGMARPEGALPFELPSSMAAVRQQLADVPADSSEPLFPTGFGLRYE